MRGLYSARYLKFLENHLKINDFGKCFDLIVGTSTGAILGCGLALGVQLQEVINLYRNQGRNIFSKKLPSGFKVLLQRRKNVLKNGEANLKKALNSVFGSTTVADIYKDRQLALAITAINFETQKSWVFKTPHNSDTNHRDDDYTLTDICLATSAAPIYRSLASIKNPDTQVENIFVDGGLWANNPILVAITEALRVTENDQKIEIFSLGTCAPVYGDVFERSHTHWGIKEWKGGAGALELAMNAQTFANEQIANMLCNYIDRDIEIIRFPQPPISSAQTKYLSLDATDDASCNFLEKKAQEAFDITTQELSKENHPFSDSIKRLKQRNETKNV